MIKGIVKCPPPSTLMYAFIFRNDKRDWEGPGHLKFLNTLQEDTENNFSYLVPMNIVNSGGVGGGGWRGGQSTPG